MSDRIILHVTIPGEPIAQERHRWGKSHNYDPNAKDKKHFQWAVKAACPRIQQTAGDSRLGILLEIWSAKNPVRKKETGTLAFQTDWDNYGKFYCDALSGLLYDDDWRIEDGRVIVHRSALEPRVVLKVWELP